MRLKKAFTLAEILIVLMVIGALATLTIPAMMRGVNETQWKTAYKKAYNAIVNLTAMERIAGQLPTTPDADGIKLVFSSLRSNLAVKDYAAYKTTAGATYAPSDYLTESDAISKSDFTGDKYWLITEDNIAYLELSGGSGDTCKYKADINAATTLGDAIQASCVYVLVDVNGLGNGPNTVEQQQSTALAESSDMLTLTGDRYYIFIGKDGAAAGHKTKLVTGRIAADIR